MKDLSTIPDDQELTKTELHGKQFIDTTGQGVISLAEKLDQKAGETSDKLIFMGEEVPADHLRDYGTIEEQAKIRQQERQRLSRELSDQLIKLENNNTDSWAAEGIVGKIVKKMLFNLSKAKPELAAQMFDQATADGLAKAAHLQAMGRDKEARLLEAEVEKNAPEASYCGAGSCGLETANNSQDIAKVNELGLKGDLLHDTERSCPGCSKKKIYYDKKGSKACAGCGQKEIKAG
jgi:hypothetical protein